MPTPCWKHYWRQIRTLLLVLGLFLSLSYGQTAHAQSTPDAYDLYLPIVENRTQTDVSQRWLHGLLQVAPDGQLMLLDPWETSFSLENTSAIDWQDFDGHYVSVEGKWAGHNQSRLIVTNIRTLSEDGERYRTYVGREMSNPSATPIRDADRAQQLQTAKLFANPAEVGEWSAVQDIGMYALHAALRPDGNVLFWYRTAISNPNDPTFNTIIWEPDTGATTSISNDSALGEENWCASHTQLGDGRILAVTGEVGAADPHTTIFDPLRNVWTPEANLNYGRYYPSATFMGDGRAVVSGGDYITPGTNTVANPFPEVWEDGAWRVFADPLTITPTPTEFDFYYGSFFPWTQQAPNGQIFYAGPQSNLRFLDPHGIGTVTSVSGRDGRSRDYGSYATYDIGKVLVTGGGWSLDSAYTIDYNSDTPIVTQTGSMTHGRRHLYTTILADGTVLATGGNGDGGVSQASPSGAVFAAELWNPETGVWTELAEMERRREYHSSAILLPDGRVVHAGGDCTPCSPEANLEVFSPPYLFDADGSLATRPVINTIERVQTGAPISTANQPEIDYGERLRINFGAANAIAKAHLIRLGSSTHATNFDQRLVPLDFTSSGNDLNVIAPQNTYIAPPGYYMLFVVSDTGVPSVATMIKLGTDFQKLEHVLNFRDGGFEDSYTPPVGAWFMYVAGSMFGSWTVDYGNIDVQHNANSGAGIGSDGEQQVDLNGTEPGKISQQLSGLIPNQTYEIRFNYATHQLASLAEATVQIADLNQTWQATNAHNEPWHTAIYTFTPSSGSHTLSFAGGGPLTYAGMLIDNIHIQEYVPPPASGRPPINLALNKPATQSSQQAGTPSVAVNGNTNGDGQRNEITRTNTEEHPWWQVDLGQSEPIERVNIWNQTDCCAHTLHDFYIFISDADLTGQSLTQILNDQTVDRIYSAGVFSSTHPISITKQINSRGRYVRVQGATKESLGLAEVQVYSPPRPNQPPVVTAPSAQTNNINDLITLTISATDPENDPITYQATNLPPTLTLDQNSGTISGTITTAGRYTVTLTATDLYDSSAPVHFTWIVNGPPSVINPGDQYHTVGDAVTLPIQASDDDSATLTFSATNLPTGLTLEPSTGLISGTISASGTYTVAILVTDSSDSSDSATFTWHINNPPVISAPANQTSIISDTVSLQLSATDPENDPLTYSAGSLPPNLTIDTTTGLISGIVTTPDTYTVLIVVSDGKGGSTTTEFTWTVTYPPNNPPVLDAPTDQYHTVGQAIQLPITAADPDNDPLTFTTDGLPGGLTITTTITAVTTSTAISGTAISPGTYPVTLTVTDGNSGSATANFNWQINGVPNITFPGDQNSTVGDPIAFQIEATDFENQGVIFSASNLPNGLVLNPSTGHLTGTLQAAGIFNVIVTVDDGRGGISTVDFTWTVNEPANAPPALTPVVDQTNLIGDSVQLQLTATDSDGDPLQFSVENLPDGLTLNPTSGEISGTVTTIDTSNVIVTVNDGRGGTSDISFIWIVDTPPNQQPRISNPGPQENTAGETVTLRLIAIDQDGDDLRYNLASLPDGLAHNEQTGIISGTLTQEGLYEVQFTVYDGQGGSDGVSFDWRVHPHPNRAPQIQPIPDQTSEVNDAITLQIEATDLDGDPLQFTVAGLPFGLVFDQSSITISGTLTTAGVYTTSVTVDDGEADPAQIQFVWSVSEPPTSQADQLTLTPPETQQNQLGEFVSLPLDAVYSEETAVTFTAQGLPSGLNIQPQSGIISGTVAQAGEYTITVTIEQQGNTPVEVEFIWIVTQPAEREIRYFLPVTLKLN